MNKVVYFILFLISINLTLAIVKDDGRIAKTILEVEDCVNLTIKYTLNSGNSTPLSFDGCIDKGSNTWFCDCKGYTNGFNITMRTDKTILREPREYDITLDYTLFNYYSNFDDFEVKDWGDYIEVEGEKITYTNSSKKCSTNVKVIYVNQTVEVEKIVDRIEYKDREVPVQVIEYVENLTTINTMNETINNLTLNNTDLNEKYDKVRHQRNNRLIWIIILSVALIISIFGIYQLKYE